MYEQFYGLQEKPFNVTPDTKYFFPGEKHQEALNSLIYALNERKGFVTVTGEIGSGKTTVWHALLNALSLKTKVALITNPRLTPRQMMMAILEELEIPFRETWPKVKLLSALNSYLLEQISLGFNVALIVDEAQNLSPDALEEVRLLSNLETEKEKLLQIILMGQPELKSVLALPRLKQLRQRISVYYHIAPLTLQETQAYIFHRLRVAGNSAQDIFNAEALAAIYRHTGGIPRRINNLCDSALLTGFVREVRVLDAGIIDETAHEMAECVVMRGESVPAPQGSTAVSGENVHG